MVTATAHCRAIALVRPLQENGAGSGGWRHSGDSRSGLRNVAWSPTLLRLVIEELFVEEDFVQVCGDPRTLPVHLYPQAILVALGARHSWREDDLKRFARRAGLRSQPGKRR